MVEYPGSAIWGIESGTYPIPSGRIDKMEETTKEEGERLIQEVLDAIDGIN